MRASRTSSAAWPPERSGCRRVGLVSQFIPTVGTYLVGALPSAHRAAERPVDAIWVLLYIVVYQQFENIVLPPRITARTMALHPEVAFGAVIAGGAIMGPIESPLALPAAASVQAVVSLYVDRYEVVADPLIAAPDPSAVPADAPPGPERE